MSQLPGCPKCNSEYTYEDREMLVCPECGHEWLIQKVENADAKTSENDLVIKDANGLILQDGDDVVVIKDLKIGGGSDVIKVGTKVKRIRLVDSGDGHDIDCKIKGFGAMKLKSIYVKKSK